MIKFILKYLKIALSWILSFLTKADEKWISDIIFFTEGIKTALNSTQFDFIERIIRVDNKVIDNFLEILDEIKLRLSYLDVEFDKCLLEKNDDKKVVCLINSIANANLSEEKKTDVYQTIAFMLVDMLKIEVLESSNMAAARTSSNFRYEQLKMIADNYNKK